VLLATLFTLLNAWKPLHVDDAAYYYYAKQIAAEPLNPYGFQVFWWDRPDAANEVLAPPLLPYWWAAAIRLFGPSPVLWKLWLFPFSLLFVGSLNALLQRFTRGLEAPLLWMTILSPAFLPSLNLMLDVPALALSLASVVLFLRAVDRGSWGGAALAGLVAGLAIETKYTGFLAPPTMLLYALTGPSRPAGARLSPWRRLGLWLAAVVLTVAVFVAWEGFIHYRYGVSHFLFHYQRSSATLAQKLADYSLPLLALLGATTPAIALLGLAALGKRRGTLVGAGLIVCLGYVLIACLTAAGSVELTANPLLFGQRSNWIGFFSLEQVIFTGFGVATGAVMAMVLGRLLRVPGKGLWRPALWRRYRAGWFLALWLGLEVAGYFALTPFPAVRRILGLVVIGTLLAGRLASRTCRRPGRRALVYGVAAGGMLLGLGFYGLDFREAWARKEAAEWSASLIRAQDRAGRIWYVGHWGFQFYAERAGLWPVEPGDSQGRLGSELHRADWLVVPADGSLHKQGVVLDPGSLERVMSWEVADRFPLQTGWSFYGTATGVPLTGLNGPRVRIDIYRATRDIRAKAQS
jgi:hypothetical protein